VKTAAVLLALAGALVLQATLSGLIVARLVPVNLVLVAVVYLALAYGAATGMFAGMAAGLVQDVLAGGIVGIGGIAKTLIGFLVGVLGAQFIVSNTLPRFLMFVAATFGHDLLFEALQGLIAGRGFAPHYRALLLQALVNGVVGVAAFWIVERGPDVVARRRSMRRASLSKRRF
jgi:rod shape-determining protein MreD